ncbi:MAG: FIST C-terminal domain-containing protein [Thioalkalispiraceae bacterium]|jgi:small ligand-binding sensory domain FIST
MERYLLAHSNNANWEWAVNDCLGQLSNNGLNDPTADATLGFVYFTDKYAGNSGEILRKLKEATGIADWVGTIGMAICCTGKEYYDQPAIAILITDIPKTYYRIFDSPDKLPNFESTDKQTALAGVKVAIVHGDPRNGQLPNIIHTLPEKIGNGFLAGGLTSSDSFHYQFANELDEGTLSGVVLDDTVPVITGLTQGCSPVGGTHTITECDGNIAIQIDDRPALDVMKDEIGEVLSRDLNRIGGYIFAGFPIPGTDTGDYMVRNLMGIDTNSGAIAIGEYLQNNKPIMFCKRDGTTAIEDLKQMVSKVKARTKDHIKGGLYFSCLGRGQHMFGEVNREMEIIEEILGDVPLVGFYANGEIAGDQLYGYTGVMVLFI